MSQPVRLEGKHTTQTAHCALLVWLVISREAKNGDCSDRVMLIFSPHCAYSWPKGPFYANFMRLTQIKTFKPVVTTMVISHQSGSV